MKMSTRIQTIRRRTTAILAAFACLTAADPFLLAKAQTDSANGTWYGNALRADYGNLKCYYPSSLAGPYGITFMNGATAWNSSANPGLVFTVQWSREAYSESQAQARISAVNNGANNKKASTTFFSGGSSVNPNWFDWDYCEIEFNTYYGVDAGTMAHEIGHVMGLGDRDDDPGSIMYRVSADRQTTVPTMADCIALNRLHYDLLSLGEVYYEE